MSSPTIVGAKVSHVWLIVSETIRSMLDEIQFMPPSSLPSRAGWRP